MLVIEGEKMIAAVNLDVSLVLKMFRIAIDLVLVWLLIYYVISAFRNNVRTLQLFKGIIVIALVKVITSFFGLTTLGGIVDAVLTYGVLGIIIIFQPEIRAILEKMGQTNNDYVHTVNLGEREKILNELVNCVTDLSKTQTGALITFERRQSLQDFINTGIKFDAQIKSELLKTIFYEGTPLHDGATIIKNDRIVASACFYPPTNKEVPAKYGARHRAAIGISEITDSLTIVVSEETGTISFATDGDLRPVNPKELRAQLVSELDWYHSDEGDKQDEW